MLTRVRDQELMDNPLLDSKEHVHALEGLARLNAVSGAARTVWRPIRRLYQQHFATAGGAGYQPRPRAIRILDVACGSGDIALSLADIAANAGIEIRVDGCDISQVAVNNANERASRHGYDCKFFQLDALRDGLPADYDVITNSLFMHHLSEEEAAGLLRKMCDATKALVVVHDLVRSPASLMLVTLACRTLTRSSVVHFDGPASVRAAFTPVELRAIAQRANVYDATVTDAFPCRMLLTWRKRDSV